MKIIRISILFLLLLAGFASCSRNGDGGNNGTAPGEEEQTENIESVLISPDDQDVDLSAPVMKDSDMISGDSLTALDRSVFDSAFTKTSADGQSLLEESIDLSSLTVNYFSIPEGSGTLPSSPAHAGPLKIVDYGPRGEVPIEMRKPVLFVQFNQPMVPMGKLGEPMRKSPVMTMTPEVPGTFRWYGTKILSFEPDEPMHRNRDYRITVSKNTTSLYGRKLGRNFDYVFQSEPLEILSLMFGTWDDLHDSPMEVPPAKADKILVTFNQTVDSETMKDYLRVASAGDEDENPGFTVSVTRPEAPETGWPENSIRRTLLLTLDREPAVEKSYQVELLAGARANGDSTPLEESRSSEFSTLSAFRFDDASRYNYDFPYEPEGVRNPVYLGFSHPLDPDSIPGNVASSFQGVDMKDHIRIFGSAVRVADLPVEYESVYTLTLGSGIRDIYGRSLEREEEVEIDVPAASSYSYFPGNNGLNSLESEFPPAVIYEYQNIDEGTFTINGEVRDTGIAGAPRNQAVYRLVDLKPYTNSEGYGKVNLSWSFTQKYKDWKGRDREYINKRDMTVQVTDLGITTRYGYNRFLVWINRLSTGESVENARVILSGYGGYRQEVRTDEKGLAVFQLLPGEYVKGFYNPLEKRYEANLAAEEGTDRVDLPVWNTQYGGRFGYDTSSPQMAEKAIPRVFLFSDRGIYRPGETLTYRGVDWNQHMGSFEPYEGSYKISIMKSEGWSRKTVTSWQGETSESGGFFSTYKVPEDMEPGQYTIRYERDRSRTDVDFKVAYFRRLNFQVNMKTPLRPFYLGDKVSIPLEASYLAGGAMAGGDLSYFWTRKPLKFSPPGEKWSSWVFGPGGWEQEMTISSGDQKLNLQGTSLLEVETADHSLGGMPYRYVVEGTVQDIDRQSISAATSVVVHPASWYIGARRGSSSDTGWWARFLPVKKEIRFALAQTAIDGRVADEPGDALVEVIKGSYKAVQQNSIGSRISTRYEWVEETLESDEITWKDGFSSYSYTPEEAGSYRLRITGHDRKDREVITDLNFYASGGSWVRWAGQNMEDITLEMERDLYFPGETARILVKSPLEEGRYLLTIEREGILEERFVDLNPSNPILEIPVKEEWVPVMYVTLSGVMPRTSVPASYSDPDFGKPKGIFGAAAINISTRSRELDLEITSDQAVYRPGGKGEITVRVTRDGQPVPGAEVTYLAVDRGVLDIINYHIPNPLQFFYDKNNFDMYGGGDDSRRLLLAPVTYETANLAGGDGDESKLQRREDFTPLAVFEPFLTTNERGEVKVPVSWPDTLTTYRSTVIALKGQKIGYSEDEIFVKNPVNVRTALPRQMRVRDTGIAGVVLTNIDDRPHELSVSVASDILGLPGTTVKTVTLPAGQSREVPFILEGRRAGEGEVVFTITSDILKEELVEKMKVEEPVIRESFTSTGIVGEEENTKEEALLIPSAIGEGYGSLRISLDSSQIPFLREQLKTLGNHKNYDFTFDYLYAAVPAVTAPEVTALMGQDFDKRSRDSLAVFMKTAAYRQMSDGGISSSDKTYSDYSDPYCSLVTLHIMEILNSQDRLEGMGSAAPDLGDLKKYIKAQVEDGAGLYYSLYAHYLLTLAGEFDKAQTEEFAALKDELGISGYGLLGAVYALEGRDAELKELYQRVKNFVSIGTRSVDIRDSYESRFYFDSGYQQLSHLLRLGLLTGENPEMIRRYSASLDIQKGPRNWLNDQDRLWMVIALSELMKGENPGNTDFTGRVSLKGDVLAERAFKGLSGQPEEMEFSLFDQVIPLTGQNSPEPLRFEKEGRGTLFYTATLNYALPNEVAPARDEGLSVFTQIETLEGEVLKDDVLELGETYRMRVLLNTSKTRSYVNLAVPIPSGAEIVDPSFSVSSSFFNQGGNQSETWKRETAYGDEMDVFEEGYLWRNYRFPIRPNQVIMNHEIRYSWSSLYYGQREVTFLFSCTTPGIYPTPPARADLLFEPEVFGRDRGRLIVVR